MKKIKTIYPVILLTLLLLASCKSKKNMVATLPRPVLNSDSIYPDTANAIAGLFSPDHSQLKELNVSKNKKQNTKEKTSTDTHESSDLVLRGTKITSSSVDVSSVYTVELEEYAELMAIATIGDVVDLSDENRVIVKYGLKHLAVTPNVGIKALVEACELEIDEISSYHIGFVIGPCLNATGRLDSAKRAIELLLTTDIEEARKKALELRALNVERKDITEEYAAIAIEQVENTELKDDKVLVVYLPDCHESVAGIIAGRVREKFYRPSIVITKAEDGAKGSGRSIEGYNMFEEISKCGKLLNKYGGHPMAAGISLDIDKIDEFRKTLNENQTMTEKDLTPTVWIDVPMPVDYVDIKLIKQFERLQPFGKGNEKPVFADRNLTVRQSAVIGKNKNVLRCQLESEHGKLVTAIKFKLDGQEIPEAGRKISMVYYPDINEYNGIVSIQFRIEDWRYV